MLGFVLGMGDSSPFMAKAMVEGRMLLREVGRFGAEY